MWTFISGFIKDIFIGLAILFVGFVMNFDWRFWLLVLLYVLRPFTDELAHRLKNRLQNRRQNHPPH